MPRYQGFVGVSEMEPTKRREVVKEFADKIREAVRTRWPETTFSIRSTFSTGIVNIVWIGKPKKEEVGQIVWAIRH